MKDLFYIGIGYISRLLGNGIVFFVLARFMSEEEFGLVSFLFLLSSFTFVVMDYGLYFLIVDAVKRANHRRQKVIRYVANRLVIAGLVASIIAIAFLFLWRKTDIEGFFYASAVMASTAFLARGQQELYFSRIHGSFYREAIIQSIYNFGVFITIVGLAVFARLSAVAVVFVYLTARSLFWFVSTRAKENDVVSNLSWFNLTKYLTHSSLYATTAIVGFLFLIIDSVIVYLMIPQDLPQYQGGARIVLILMMGAEVLSVFFYPRLIAANERMANIRVYILCSLLLASLIGVVFIGFPAPVVYLLYGGSLEGLDRLMPWFALIAIARVFIGFTGTLLSALNSHHLRLWSLLLGTIYIGSNVVVSGNHFEADDVLRLMVFSSLMVLVLQAGAATIKLGGRELGSHV